MGVLIVIGGGDKVGGAVRLLKYRAVPGHMGQRAKTAVIHKVPIRRVTGGDGGTGTGIVDAVFKMRPQHVFVGAGVIQHLGTLNIHLTVGIVSVNAQLAPLAVVCGRIPGKSQVGPGNDCFCR